jgi:hypothetical protein
VPWRIARTRDIEKMRAYPSVLAMAVIALSPVVAMADTPSPAASGIEGTISISPSRPGPIRKGEPSSAAPVRNLEFVVKKDDTPVTSFTTDGEGRFRISVPPGHYTVLREDAGSKIGRWRFEVDVVAGEIAKVNWTGDSGMR